MKLLTVEDARARMLAQAVATADEVVALGEAHGRVLRGLTVVDFIASHSHAGQGTGGPVKTRSDVQRGTRARLAGGHSEARTFIR